MGRALGETIRGASGVGFSVKLKTMFKPMRRLTSGLTVDGARKTGPRVWVCWVLASGLACGWSTAAAAAEDPSQDLSARFEQARRQGAVQLGQRPVYLQSSETAERLEGEVLALIEHPLSAVRAALAQAPAWCDILILHLNVKYCRVTPAPASGAMQRLEVGLGRKFDEPLSSVHWLLFSFRATAPHSTPNLEAPVEPGSRLADVELHALEGPLDTRNIRITVRTAPAAGGRTLLQLRYAYAQGPAARWAMQLYLATVGRHKLGFSLASERDRRTDRVDRSEGAELRGKPVTGVRALLERNTVRYYLAIDAYLDALVLPPAQQLERRLVDWFAATERHPAQLHELDVETYLQMKRLEVRRQQTEPPPRH